MATLIQRIGELITAIKGDYDALDARIDALEANTWRKVSLDSNVMTTLTTPVSLSGLGITIPSNKGVLAQYTLAVNSQASTTGIKLGLPNLSSIVPNCSGYVRVPNNVGSMTERNLAPFGAEDMVSGVNLPGGFPYLAEMNVLFTGHLTTDQVVAPVFASEVNGSSVTIYGHSLVRYLVF